MKISKSTSKTIKASDALPEGCPYCEAIDCIKCAIDSLGPLVSSDETAKEAIADLAVVYAYLQGDK